jgi:endoglycosylceramidase
MRATTRTPSAHGALGALAAFLATLAGLSCDWVPGAPPGPGSEASRLPALHAEPDPASGGRIVDAHGREVLLRGVNVNALVEYWQHTPGVFTTYPFTPADADAIAALGWNAVRLLVSWSRVEPAPGAYDKAHLDELEAAVERLASRGLYAIVDLHQDAWGPTLAARPDEACTRGRPAFGWDGAPGWATLDGGAPRCEVAGTREFSPAVMAAFQAFWDDAEGPGGVGIRTRYVRMLGHVAGRLSRHDSVSGYDVMNEPNAFALIPGQLDALSALYAEAYRAIRDAEDVAGVPHRLVLFEPSIAWGQLPSAPPPFPHEGGIVYAPHVYQGGLDATPLDRTPFERARSEAAELYGGAPIVVGEWGASPARAADPGDGYFDLHQALQDEYRFGATLWTWREACGDPHKAADYRDGSEPTVWGLFDVDCATQTVTGLRAPLAAKLARGALRAAPGRIAELVYDPVTGVLEAHGEAAAPATWIATLPGPQPAGAPRIEAVPGAFAWRPAFGGGSHVMGFARAGPWRIRMRRVP